MNLGTVFYREEDFIAYQEWIQEQGYTYEDSLKEEIVKEFTDLYYAPTKGGAN